MKPSKTKSPLISKWLKPPPASPGGMALYVERSGSRAAAIGELKKLLADHFVGEETILKAGGYPKASAIVANSLPDSKRTRSGDLGELLATEYVNSETSFFVPIKKLRWKSDRQMAMHGNDVVGVDTTQKPIRVLKGECKSRASFAGAVAAEAGDSLDLHDGRPNPSTLAFIAKRLYEEGRDEEADVYRDLQCKTSTARSTTQMIFVLSGNDPTKHLAPGPKSKFKMIKRQNAAIVVEDHAKFVAAVYETHGT
jgi:hypothetical protein